MEPNLPPILQLTAGLVSAACLLAGTASVLWLLSIARPGLQTRLARGAGWLRQRELDETCTWACLLLVIALATPAVLVAWLPPAAAPAPIQPAALLLQPLVLCLGMLALATVCARRGRGVAAAFGLARARWRLDIRDGLVYGLALVPVVLLVTLAVQHVWRTLGLDPTPQDAFGWLVDGDYPAWSRLGLAALAAVAAPVAEEALFRGVLLPSLMPRAGLTAALLLQGGLFGAAHGHAPSFLPLLVAGVGFGAGYAASGSLVTPIVMHAVFNLASLALFFACAN